MKKLIYNKHTNEIDIVEQEEIENLKKTENNFSKKLVRIRQRLERNKIFFEVFSLVFLGIMGAVISVVGVMINKRTTDIYQKQLEIMENDSEPSFYSELCWIDAINKEDDMQCVVDFRRSKKFLRELEKELGEHCFSETDYVVLNYVNYKNEKVFNYFSLGLEGMYVVDRDDVIKPDGIHITYSSDLDIKEITDSIKAKAEN